MSAFDPNRTFTGKRFAIMLHRCHGGPVGIMKLYRINKVAKPGGHVLKRKDVLAKSDGEAVQKAAESEDCPVCEVLKDGQQIGSIL